VRSSVRRGITAASAVLVTALGLTTAPGASALPPLPLRQATWLPSESLGNRPWYAPPPGTAATVDDAADYGTMFASGTPRTDRPTSVVQLGDSFTSGEGARNYVAGSNGYYPRFVNTPSGVQLSRDTSFNSCHRSANVAIWQVTGYSYTFNFACSGAETDEVFSSNDENPTDLPQAYYLARAAATTNVKAIVMGFGANDLGYANIVEKCAKNWLVFGPGCRHDVENRWLTSTDTSVGQRSLANTSARLETAARGVVQMMRKLGYADSDYQLIFETYANLTANPAHNASLLNIFRPGDSGCTFKEADASYFNVRGTSLMADTMTQATNRLLSSGITNVRIAYMRDALIGRERCRYRSEMAGTAVQGLPTFSPEWKLGDPAFSLIQETMHPNRLGNALLGSCINQIIAKPTSLGRYWGCRAGVAQYLPAIPAIPG
jgi:hypothetical protein